MEGDDGAVAGVFVNLAQYLTAIELGIVVARHEVPHDDAVALAQCAVLPEAHDAVRRTEKVALDRAISVLDEREKKIIRLRYYEGKTQMEISKEVGISQAQVSRLEKSALSQIRNGIRA